MTTTQTEVETFDTAAIGSILGDRYPVARTGLNRIWLRTPASAMNAADWLRRQGIDAHAELSGQWHVRIWR
jgi:hypothetical protein